MTIKSLGIALTAVSLLLGSALANAGQYDNHPHDRGSKHSDNQKRSNKQHAKQYEQRDVNYDNSRRNYHAYKPKAEQGNNGWHRGQYLPVTYQSSRYRVNDWRAYQLSAPPRGYEWRRIDNRFVQVSSNNYQIARVW